MNKFSYSNAMIEFYQKNSLKLLSPDEVLKITSKNFSTSPFALNNKEATIETLKTENVIFAFPEGIVITPEKFHVFAVAQNNPKKESFSIDDFFSLEAVSQRGFFTYSRINVNGIEILKSGHNIKLSIDLYDELKLKLKQAKEDYNTEIQRIADLRLSKREEKLRQEKEALEKKHRELNENQMILLSELDKDGNGEIDLIQNDFNKLLNYYQKKIIELDKDYVHKFVKVSNFIKTKKVNIQKIFESIRNTSSQKELDKRFNLLKHQIHAYELLVFNAINMIGALLSDDLISFYEVYESFDKLNIFNSNWENEVSEKLKIIGSKLDDLMYSIYKMEQNIVSELSQLSYTTQQSYNNLNIAVTSQLKEIESAINMNNVLTSIQIYQSNNIDENNKGLRYLNP